MIELDGQPVSPEDLSALGLYNYAHFTTMRVENAAVRGLSLHLERLVRDCKAIHGADLDPGNVQDLARRAPIDSPVIVRVTIFDPALDLGHPGIQAEPHVLVTTRPAPTETLPPLNLQTVRYERELPQVKHGGLFGTLYHRRNAQLNGLDDVLFVDRNSCICEGATWNIGFLHEDKVVWPSSNYLEGVTMRLVNEVMIGADLEFEVSALGVDDVSRMRSAFVTNAAVGIRPVASIDGLDLSAEDPTLALLQAAYTAIPGEPL